MGRGCLRQLEEERAVVGGRELVADARKAGEAKVELDRIGVVSVALEPRLARAEAASLERASRPRKRSLGSPRPVGRERSAGYLSRSATV